MQYIYITIDFFFWLTFNHSVKKTDFVLTCILIYGDLIFNRDNMIVVISDFFIFVYVFISIFLLRYYIMEERRIRSLMLATIRLFLELQMISRVISYTYSSKDNAKYLKDKFLFLVASLTVIGKWYFLSALIFRCTKIYLRSFNSNIYA